MYYLIYASQSVKDWSTQELAELLQQSKKNNNEKGITGMLVYSRGRFMQILEGEKNQVLSLFNRIEKDERHKSVFVVLEGNTEKRIFEKWSMGFKALEQSELYDLSAISNLDELFNEDKVDNHCHPALIFLKLFYEKNIRDDVGMVS